jgi:hypothetical protein
MTNRKRIMMLTAADRSRRGSWKDAVLADARRTLETGVELDRLVVNLVDPPPAEIPYRPENETGTADGLPGYDVILELKGSVDVVSTVLEAMAALDSAGLRHEFVAEEWIEKDEQPIVLGERSPGIKYMGRLMFHADLPDSAARRSWNIHVPLALRVHAGASKYVRNWVLERSGAGVPDTRGISELHFRSLDDLIRRFFDSEQGKAEVLHDLSHFVASGSRLYCSEYVLKA